MEQENYRRLLPGYIRRFVRSAAPLLDMKLEGDLEEVFHLAPERARASTPYSALWRSIRRRCRAASPCLGHRRVATPSGCIPASLCSTDCVPPCWRATALRQGAAQFSLTPMPTLPISSFGACLGRSPPAGRGGPNLPRKYGPDRESMYSEVVESRLVGLRQDSTGAIKSCPLEHLLLLHGAHPRDARQRTACPPGARAGRGRGRMASERHAGRHGGRAPCTYRKRPT